jgi:3-deoxy-D-manno-octulosonic-acid transferase
MFYYQSIYTRGDKSHVHVTVSGERFVCFKKHRKPDYSKLWLVGISVVELILILFLINKQW